jgi:hypothetical protein
VRQPGAAGRLLVQARRAAQVPAALVPEVLAAQEARVPVELVEVARRILRRSASGQSVRSQRQSDRSKSRLANYQPFRCFDEPVRREVSRFVSRCGSPPLLCFARPAPLASLRCPSRPFMLFDFLAATEVTP